MKFNVIGTVINRAISLDHKVRLASVENLNRLLADTMTLARHVQKASLAGFGSHLYQLHLLFDKHYTEQAEIVDALAERVQTLGGVAIAMAPDVAETRGLRALPGAARMWPCRCSVCCRRMS